jgi:hypothetical protein
MTMIITIIIIMVSIYALVVTTTLVIRMVPMIRSMG